MEQNVLDHRNDPVTSFALTGACGVFGRSLLAQAIRSPRVRPAILVDPDLGGLAGLLDELGLLPGEYQVAESAAAAARTLSAGQIALVPGSEQIVWDGVEVLVEATGRPSDGHAYAADALAHQTHVVMVSKEVESVAGVSLAATAREKDLSYLPADGDQPANLLRLLRWVELAGLDVVALGKAGEYDLVFDPTTETVTHHGECVPAAPLAGLLSLGENLSATLAARADAVSAVHRRAAADSCEMAVVSLYSGAVPDIESLHYPVARLSELADIYALRADGGLTVRDRNIDVFSLLRLPGEASIAGGVFVVVRMADPVTAGVLAEKGHVISRCGRYACIYLPYHLMGVETLLTVQEAADRDRRLPEPRHHTVLGARAERDLPAGTRFRVRGHHHEIAGVAPVLLDRESAGRADDQSLVSAYYLLADALTRRPVRAGELVRLADLEDTPSALHAAFTEGFAL